MIVDIGYRKFAFMQSTSPIQMNSHVFLQQERGRVLRHLVLIHDSHCLVDMAHGAVVGRRCWNVDIDKRLAAAIERQ